MKKTLQIHIGSRQFHIDEDGYNKLNHYLDSLKSHFAAEGESGKEIVEDIEQRIAELLENKITPSKQAVSLEDVQEIIGILGKVEDFVYTGQSADQPEYDHHERRDYRRFYRDSENSYFGGVASGMGEYFDIDPLWIRLAFVALAFLKGLGIIIYAILWIVVPKARTTSEKLQMKGKPVNLSTIKESVNAEYDKVKSNLEGFNKSSAAERTRSALENIMRAIGLVIVAIFKFIIGAIGIFFLVIGSVFLACLVMFLLGFTNFFGHFQIYDGLSFPEVSHLFASSGHYYLVLVSLIVLVLIPIIALIYGGVKILFNIRTRHPVLRAFVLTAWILALILFITLIIANSTNYAVGATGTRTTVIETGKYPRIYIDVQDNTADKHMIHYWVLGHRFNYSEWDEALYSKAKLSIVPSDDEKMQLTIDRRVNNVGIKDSQQYLERIEYQWEQQDSVLYLNEYFNTDDEDFWMFSSLDIKLRVPEGQVIAISENTCNLLEDSQRHQYCDIDNPLVNKSIVVTTEGELIPARQKSSLIRNK